MLDLLEEQAIEKDTQTLDKFYESVKMRAQGIDNAEGKQKIIIDSVTAIVEESNKQLKAVDLTEAFKSDDQIGFFFRNLQNIQDSLNHYLRN